MNEQYCYDQQLNKIIELLHSINEKLTPKGAAVNIDPTTLQEEWGGEFRIANPTDVKQTEEGISLHWQFSKIDE